MAKGSVNLKTLTVYHGHINHELATAF